MASCLSAGFDFSHPLLVFLHFGSFLQVVWGFCFAPEALLSLLSHSLSYHLVAHRVGIQDEAKASRRRHSTEIRASEQARQWDRQRGDIHPAIVSEQLANIEAKKLAPPKLPPARPDADDARPVRILPVRKM